MALEELHELTNYHKKNVISTLTTSRRFQKFK